MRTFPYSYVAKLKKDIKAITKEIIEIEIVDEKSLTEKREKLTELQKLTDKLKNLMF